MFMRRRRLRNRVITSGCQPEGLSDGDPPERRAYLWGRHARTVGDEPMPEDFPGCEGVYMAGYEKRRAPRIARKPKTAA